MNHQINILEKQITQIAYSEYTDNIKFSKINDIILNFIKEHYFYKTKSIYAKFPIHYHIIPYYFRKILMNFYYRLQCENYDELLIENNIGNFCDKYLLARETEKNVYITFDIDTLQGYKKIDYFLNYLLNRKKENFKIIVFLPVCAFRYSEGHLLDLLKSGIEIACHGYDHSGKMQFDNEIKISEKLKKIKEFSIKFKVTKFRAPAFILTQNLYDKIKLDFQEDWSVRDAYVKSGHLFGCFYSGILYDDNFILRILNTLPDCDYVKTKFDDKMILKLMFDKLRYLEENNFSPILLFHPEPQFSANARNFEIFKQIITYF